MILRNFSLIGKNYSTPFIDIYKIILTENLRNFLDEIDGETFKLCVAGESLCRLFHHAVGLRLKQCSAEQQPGRAEQN